jgi:hypothetical protein
MTGSFILFVAYIVVCGGATLVARALYNRLDARLWDEYHALPRFSDEREKKLEEREHKTTVALCIAIAVCGSLIVSPLFYELPSDLSGKSVATIAKDGQITYHVYGALTSPWRWGETVVMMRHEREYIGHLERAIRDQDGEVGVLTFGGVIASTDVEVWQVAKANKLSLRRNISWLTQKGITEYLVDHNERLNGLNVKDEDELKKLCDEIIADVNPKIAEYGVGVERCVVYFSPQDAIRSW